ncbi:cytidylate kinase-like family protein [Deferribacteraceae bacterium V6Fe1]|nr:cytidylate kinase-like family protein [Deferribacteraceae bacterium V6Fe1]
MAIITISKEFGCAGDYVAERVAKKLNYKIINKEIIEYVSILTDTDREIVKDYDEERHSNFKATLSKYVDFSIFKDIFNLKDEELKYCRLKLDDDEGLFQENINQDLSFDSEKYQNTVEKIIHKLAQKDNVVIVGRGGQFILKGYPNAIHIRLYADKKSKIQWVSKREKIDEKTAEQKIQEIEKKRYNYIMHYYNEDVTDLNHYHLAINLSKSDIDEVSKMIVAMIKERFAV